MTERKFILDGATFISCTQPCDKVNTLLVEGDKIKDLGGKTATVRCVALGAPQRGQKFNFQGDHTQKPDANRICTIYNK